MFSITFTPVEYGKMKLGKLIIQTDKKYWSYRVEGTFPHYNPPKIEKMSNISGIYNSTDSTNMDKNASIVSKLQKK